MRDAPYHCDGALVLREYLFAPRDPVAPAPLSQALLGDSGGQNWSTGTPDKYGRFDRELQLANSHFIEEQQAQQQVLRARQPRAGGGGRPRPWSRGLCC